MLNRYRRWSIIMIYTFLCRKAIRPVLFPLWHVRMPHWGSPSQVIWLLHQIQCYCWKPWNLLQIVCGQMPSNSVGRGLSHTKLTDMLHQRCLYVYLRLWMCVCLRVCMPTCVAVLLGSASRPTEERRKSSTALHHMPNMGLPANLWGILASASKAEFLTEGDE